MSPLFNISEHQITEEEIGFISSETMCRCKVLSSKSLKSGIAQRKPICIYFSVCRSYIIIISEFYYYKIQ